MLVFLIFLIILYNVLGWAFATVVNGIVAIFYHFWPNATTSVVGTIRTIVGAIWSILKFLVGLLIVLTFISFFF